jgi:hypothetical protein
MGFTEGIPSGPGDQCPYSYPSRQDRIIGEMQYEDTYRLAYIRGPEGIIVALSEQLG